MEIKVADVAKLRKMTGAGMMDCKNALTEAGGDFDRAQEIIREKGKLVAAKRADRETTEGAVIARVTDDKKKGIVAAVGCETDFVSKNDDFKALANTVADLASTAFPPDKDSLMNLKSGQFTIAELIAAQTGKSGEKHVVAFYDKIEGEYLSWYIHMNNKLATVAAFDKVIDEQAGRNIAMQITAMNPVSISREDCPRSIIEKESELAREAARQEGRPENMIEKIAEGKLAKFFKENTLNEQTFIKDGKISVDEYLKSVDKDVKVTGFVRFSLND